MSVPAIAPSLYQSAARAQDDPHSYIISTDHSHVPDETRRTPSILDEIVDGFKSDIANVAMQLAHPLHVFSPHVPGSPVKSLHRSNHGPLGGLESVGHRDERRGIIEILEPKEDTST
jgi:hypothetical protein